MYISSAHSKYLLLYHLILCVKYRHPLLAVFGDEVKDKILEISKTSRFDVIEQEVERDHIHILLSTKPDISPSHIVKLIKSQTTQELYRKHPNRLKLSFWKNKKSNIFWSPSYFICTIGSVSKEAIIKYIQEQG